MDAPSNRFLASFSPEGKERLLGQSIPRNFASGAYLFKEGDQPVDGIYLVLEGQVEIVKCAENHEQILGCFQAGDYLGEVAVLDGHGRSTDARARGAVSAATIPTTVLLEVLETEPLSLTLHLFTNVLNHLRRTNDLFIHEVVHKEKLAIVGEMASSLMHDLRNPLTGIRMAAELVTLNHHDEETVHCCGKILLQCDRVVTMAGELLEFSRGEARLDLALTTTTAFLQQFMTLNEDYFQSTGVEFDFEVLPAPIEVDSMRLHRLLQNLISNAVEAIGSKPGGRIKVAAGVRENVFYITVADNGPGIPEAIRERIFEPFVTHGKKNGTGLGMAIAQSVVTAHRGTIAFTTELGKGTEFLIELPQEKIASPAEPASK